ncbi:Uncharacterised protein [Mycobacteroides abscessus]|nr:Uncharacterised protein [Mycobacteroides abscessus]
MQTPSAKQMPKQKPELMQRPKLQPLNRLLKKLHRKKRNQNGLHPLRSAILKIRSNAPGIHQSDHQASVRLHV